MDIDGLGKAHYFSKKIARPFERAICLVLHNIILHSPQ